MRPARKLREQSINESCLAKRELPTTTANSAVIAPTRAGHQARQRVDAAVFLAPLGLLIRKRRGMYLRVLALLHESSKRFPCVESYHASRRLFARQMIAEPRRSAAESRWALARAGLQARPSPLRTGFANSWFSQFLNPICDKLHSYGDYRY